MILITRPEAAGALFADQLRDRLGCGAHIVLSPLMRIEIAGKLPDINVFDALIFTSRNGVDAFAAQTDRRDIPCYCVGEATACRAQKYGMKAASSAGAANDLVAYIVSKKVNGRYLHVRGEYGVGDVAARLTDAGILTEEIVLYRQVQQPLSDQARDLLRGRVPVALPLFSPRTARILFSTINMSAPLSVIALSKNVAKEVPEAYFEVLKIAERPDAKAMISAIEVIVSEAKLLEARNRAQ
ncbi:uroporphyrinogen-III synthase [uncultured Roseovarius sp.]|uniref:uroporphyrinogen-III synthase n=1 Tax=uncultured Roseovarius sp. TaxID=293344 RepID=UPI002637F7C7|nr:uroporphyrinogen-III synthase [uncultured Roseovarius sp.]